MFIISLTYIKPIEEIDALLESHSRYLQEEYAKGNFIASGRKVPRTGGIILSQIQEQEKIKEIIQRDPFYQAGVAEYEIIQFTPSMVADGFENLKPNP